jgi:FkbM family methyltransferase
MSSWRQARSAYGPLLIERPNDVTFKLSMTAAYGMVIPEALDSIDGPFAFLDIGANAGIFSLVAASRTSCAKVVAIEPVPDTFAVLVQNIRLNEADRILPLCGAVTDLEVPYVGLTYNADHSGSSRVTRDIAAATIIAPVIQPSLLNSILEDHARIVVKIDVEGHEVHALNALRATRFFPRITDLVIEISAFTGGGSEHPVTTRGALQSMGFVERTTQRDGPKVHYDAHFTRQRAK